MTVDEVAVVTSILGGFIISFGLVSYFVKERLYLSEALVSVIVGIILGPIALGILDPPKWGAVDEITHSFTSTVIAIQVMCSGVALPKAYLVKQWKTLGILLLPVAVYMWIVSGLFIWWLIPKIKFLEALAMAACITPTDPILANSVIKGRFAEKHVPPHVRNLLSAESASNDGLALPFLFLAIYLMDESSVGTAISKWVLSSCLFQFGLSCVIGIVVGYVARKLLYLAENKRLIDKESFLVFAIALALFLTGIVAIIGSNELFVCFIAGTSFTWDEWFRKQTEEAHLQEVIDMLLNLAIFVYVGAIIPWSSFNDPATGITVWRLVACAVLILAFRRLPIILALMKWIPAIKTYREAAFTGWFGPMGISGIYYTALVRRLKTEGFLYEAVNPVVSFLVLSSILVHGITVPLVKISRRINTRSLTGGTITNQVSRLPVIRIGTDIIFRPKTDQEKTTPSPHEVGELSENGSTTTTITIEDGTSTHDNGKQIDQEEVKEEESGISNIPQDLMDKVVKKPSIEDSGLLSSKYAIWDEGDSLIIENYNGEDIHVIPSSRRSSSSSQEQNISNFFRKKASDLSLKGGFFRKGPPNND